MKPLIVELTQDNIGKKVPESYKKVSDKYREVIPGIWGLKQWNDAIGLYNVSIQLANVTEELGTALEQIAEAYQESVNLENLLISEGY